MNVDGSYSREGNSARIVLVSLKGKDYKFISRLNIECTNNVAKYEALFLV